MSDPLRILHVIASLAPRYGGPAKIADLADELGRLGHHVEVLTTNLDGPVRLGRSEVPLGVPLPHGACTVTTYDVRPLHKSAPSPGLVRALRRRVPEFDVVHVHGLYFVSTLAAAFCCRRYGVPYVQQPHGCLDEYHWRHHRGRKAIYERLVERRNLARAAAIRYDSESEQRQAEAVGVRTRGFVIASGVPVPPPADEAPEPGLVVFLGRLTAKKGLDVLLEAFALVAARRPDAELQIAGPDDEGLGAVLLERASALGLGERVRLLGLVGGEEKFRLLRKASVVVAPSTTESFGAAPLDALAAGTPVVVSDGVAVQREIVAADAGLLAPRTAEGVAEATLRLLDDPVLARRSGANGRDFVASAYSCAGVARQVEAMYRQVIESSATEPAREDLQLGAARAEA